MRSIPLLKRLTVLLVLGAAASPLVPSHASAGWPPPPNATSADMADPANWPNDPGYGFSTTANGQWNLYSFMPDVSKNVRKAETASGMSVDLAWRLTIGDPSIVIAITDSGIKWDEDDLLDKVYLNHRELVNHKPLHADSSPCGGTGELAGFDCNGDGILTVSDYKDSPNLTPAASQGHPLGDRNGNGKLDAGDLILNFSDKTDDDGNGYVDDIAGWDFMKDDNNPYDDTRYGHGTGEANDSTGAANNGIGDAGVCPNCRFMPMRVGDSFITDVASFGKAVVFATDNGARIVQCALGTINMNHFAQSALDYAYSKDTLVITSMADENSRHHNVPAAANHTLPVHAITYDANSIKNATTFLGFHPCSNFGGQNLLSASGSGCSSEATGKLSGIAGLVYSAALKYNVTPQLTPGEAHSLFFTTADDIDVPESQEPGSPYKWSQPGFDQRFGYGRVNATKAVEAIRDGKIPPAVDIVSPTWFTVLYKDQATAPIEIKGTVSAKRAKSFDYVVEWAPGVQPLDNAFKAVAPEQKNLPPTMVIGSDGPLASIDLKNIDPTHERDIDSQFGENDTAITVRVRSVAHYGDPIGDVRGELRRTYYVHSDPTLAKGFPIYVGESGETSPKMVDLDGDGVRELIYPTAGGVLHVYKLGANGPSELAGFPYRALPEDGLITPAPTPNTPVYLDAPAYKTKAVDPAIGGEPFMLSPAVADLDGDGKPEIVLATFSGSIYVVGADGKDKAGWPKRLPLVPSCSTDVNDTKVEPCMDTETRIARGSFAAPVLADLDKDGKLDIIQAAFDGKVYAFHGDGTAVDGWPVEIHYTGKFSEEPKKNRILTTPAIADFNGDGIPDLLVGSNERLGSGGQAGAIYIIDGRGTKAPSLVLPNWPVTMTSFELFPLVAEGVPNAGVIASFNGKPHAIMHGNASLPLILPVDPGAQTSLSATPPNAAPQRPDPNDPSKTLKGVDPAAIFGPLSKAETPNTMLPLFAQPSVGDIDQDGVPDVIASGGSLNLAINLQSSAGNSGLRGDNLLAIWSGKTGAMMPASPMVLEDFTFFNSQVIADLDGDDYPEVITGSGGYFVHAFDGCGREPKGFPKFTGQWIISTAAVGDLDGDHKLELALGTRDGWLYVWHTEGKDDGVIEWDSFHHDNQNTGNLDTPLTQGTKGRKAAKPLTIDSCMTGEGGSSSSASSSSSSGKPDQVDPEGGCSCRAGEDDAGAYGATFALVGLGLAAARRRRRA
ncbi:Serine protease, subtilase family protein [Minicystis rosea]|nr:Serine protease, subtilase family protein [Minicystis rosea]